MAEPAKKTPPLKAAQAIGVGLSFGVGLVAQIYLLGILLGGWLDEKWGSAPWCMLGGTVLAIFVAFRQLMRGLDVWAKRGGQIFRKGK